MDENPFLGLARKLDAFYASEQAFLLTPANQALLNIKALQKNLQTLLLIGLFCRHTRLLDAAIKTPLSEYLHPFKENENELHNIYGLEDVDTLIATIKNCFNLPFRELPLGLSHLPKDTMFGRLYTLLIEWRLSSGV